MRPPTMFFAVVALIVCLAAPVSHASVAKPREGGGVITYGAIVETIRIPWYNCELNTCDATALPAPSAGRVQYVYSIDGTGITLTGEAELGAVLSFNVSIRSGTFRRRFKLSWIQPYTRDDAGGGCEAVQDFVVR